MVLVGDSAVGKTCLIKNYLENNFTDDYVPSMLEVFTGTKEINGKSIKMEIHDTSGEESFKSTRLKQ